MSTVKYVNLFNYFYETKQEIKAELHKIIDATEDEPTLNILMDDIIPYIFNEVKVHDPNDFTDEQYAGIKKVLETDYDETADYSSVQIIDNDLSIFQNYQLQKAIEEADSGKTINWDEYLKSTAKWR